MIRVRTSRNETSRTAALAVLVCATLASLAALATVAVVAPSPAHGAAAPAGPCGWVSPADLKATIAITAATEEPPAATPTCIYKGTGKSAGSRLVLQVYPPGIAIENVMFSPSPQPLSSVGTGAMFDPSTGSIAFTSAKGTFSLTYAKKAGALTKTEVPKLVALARKVAARAA